MTLRLPPATAWDPGFGKVYSCLAGTFWPWEVPGQRGNMWVCSSSPMLLGHPWPSTEVAPWLLPSLSCLHAGRFQAVKGQDTYHGCKDVLLILFLEQQKHVCQQDREDI